MSWVLALALALAGFCIAAFVLKAPHQSWEAMGAALFLGIAGYALQASPGLSGSPKAAAQQAATDPAAIVEARDALAERGIPVSNQWLVIADGLARNGQYASAAEVLLGAVEDDPEKGEAWLALGNALMAHAEGVLTPASLHAFRKAERADRPPLSGPR